MAAERILSGEEALVKEGASSCPPVLVEVGEFERLVWRKCPRGRRLGKGRNTDGARFSPKRLPN